MEEPAVLPAAAAADTAVKPGTTEMELTSPPEPTTAQLQSF